MFFFSTRLSWFCDSYCGFSRLSLADYVYSFRSFFYWIFFLIGHHNFFSKLLSIRLSRSYDLSRKFDMLAWFVFYFYFLIDFFYFTTQQLNLFFLVLFFQFPLSMLCYLKIDPCNFFQFTFFMELFKSYGFILFYFLSWFQPSTLDTLEMKLYIYICFFFCWSYHGFMT
jgi:hypothetical protein